MRFFICLIVFLKMFEIESSFMGPEEQYTACISITDQRGITLDRNCTPSFILYKDINDFGACKRKCCHDSNCDFVRFNRRNCWFTKFSKLENCQGASTQLKLRGRMAMDESKLVLFPSLRRALKHSHSGCDGGSNKFYCDNKKTCIPKYQLCNGEIDCHDGTDEAECPGVCTDTQGHVVQEGDTYQPINRADECILCICSRNRSMQTCMSPWCSSTPTCADESTPHCCICSGGDTVDYHRLHLNGTQQMVVTGLLIILIVTIIVIFSRQIFRRHVFYHQLRFNRRRNMPDGVTRGSFTPISRPELLLEGCPMSIRSNRQIPFEATVPPPSYSELYKCSCDLTTAGESCTCPCASIPLTESPPSYPGSQYSIALTDDSSFNSSSSTDDVGQPSTNTVMAEDGVQDNGENEDITHTSVEGSDISVNSVVTTSSETSLKSNQSVLK